MKKLTFVLGSLAVLILLFAACTKKTPLPKEYSKEAHDMIKSRSEFSPEEYSQIIEWYSTSNRELYDNLNKVLDENEDMNNPQELQKAIDEVFNQWNAKWPNITELGSTIAVFGPNNAIWDEVQTHNDAVEHLDKYLIEQMGKDNFNKVIKLREDVQSRSDNFTAKLQERLSECSKSCQNQ
ncbi:MAG: hypothetical protein NC217_03395 [Muribaculaceae bacterium]|nr:hypothetical protein [Muribaculaceae bacterium]